MNLHKETAFMPKKIIHFLKKKKWIISTLLKSIVLPGFGINHIHFYLVLFDNELSEGFFEVISR